MHVLSLLKDAAIGGGIGLRAGGGFGPGFLLFYLGFGDLGGGSRGLAAFEAEEAWSRGHGDRGEAINRGGRRGGTKGTGKRWWWWW